MDKYCHCFSCQGLRQHTHDGNRYGDNPSFNPTVPMPAQEAELLKNDCSPNQQKRLKDSIARALNDVGADAEDYVRYFYQGNCLPRGKND